MIALKEAIEGIISTKLPANADPILKERWRMCRDLINACEDFAKLDRYVAETLDLHRYYQGEADVARKRIEQLGDRLLQICAAVNEAGHA